MNILKSFGIFCCILIGLRIFPGVGGKTTTYIYVLLGFALLSFTIYAICDAMVKIKSSTTENYEYEEETEQENQANSETHFARSE